MANTTKINGNNFIKKFIFFSKNIITKGIKIAKTNIDVFNKYNVNRINEVKINLFLFLETKDKNNKGRKIAIKLSS